MRNSLRNPALGWRSFYGRSGCIWVGKRNRPDARIHPAHFIGNLQLDHGDWPVEAKKLGANHGDCFVRAGHCRESPDIIHEKLPKYHRLSRR